MGVHQTYYPALDMPATRGWCLKYIDDAGSSPIRRASARLAYEAERSAGRLRTDDLPVDIWVVVFFAFRTGEFVDYGHVAFACRRSDGSVKIYDSEVSAGARKPYSSIAELLAWFGRQDPEYLGYSYECDGRVYAEATASTIPIIPMDTPRVLIAGADIAKVSADTGKTVGPVALRRGEYRYFSDKFILNGATYVRTQHDKINGNRYGFLLNDMIELPNTSEVVRMLIGG